MDFDSEKRGEVVKMGSELWSRLNGVCVYTQMYICISIHIYIYICGEVVEMGSELWSRLNSTLVA